MFTLDIFRRYSMKRITKGLVALGAVAVLMSASACDTMLQNVVDGLLDQPHTCVYGEWEIVKEATCTEDGEKKRSCTCGETEKEPIEKTGHAWDEGEITLEPTYKETGVKTFTCTVCGESKEEEMPVRALFAGGLGTKDSPYLIETAEQLQNVREMYDTYQYYKIADGVESIDCTGWAKNVNLNGSFNGNGVELVNLTAALFNQVGYENSVQEITIENFTVTVNASTALVHNLINGGETTFKNVVMHGYIEGKYNLGCFYRYGTAQYEEGCDYTVNFVNCQSDVDIVETSGNVPGGLIGHAYQGSGNTVTINVDDKTAYTGTQYGTAREGHYYLCMDSGSTVLTVNGETIENFKWNSEQNKSANYQKLAIVNPTQNQTGSFEVVKQEGAVTMKVSVNAQISAYDANGEKINNESGITIVLRTNTLTALSDSTKVLHSFDTVELIANANAYTAENVEGVLRIYIMKSDSYTYEGTVSLQVTQYDANGKVIAVGSLKIATLERGE